MIRKKIFDIKFQLLFIIFIGLIISIPAINCGRSEDWNPDSMAFRNLFAKGQLFNPSFFQKPLFHTYLNFFLITFHTTVAAHIFNWPENYKVKIMMIASKILTKLLFALAIFFLFKIIKKITEEKQAFIWSAIFASSAGIIAYTNYLTADVPVMCWMLATFYCCQNIYHHPSSKNYYLAGFIIGLATATKYNALFLAPAFFLFHIGYILLSKKNKKSTMIDRNIILGILGLISGFLVCNPYSVLDYKIFLKDIFYVIASDKYHVCNCHQYLNFIIEGRNLIGWPSLVLALTLTMIAIIKLLTNKIEKSLTKITLIASLSVMLPYYLYFASYGETRTRFVLPLVPFLLIAASVAFNYIKNKFTLMSLGLIWFYNLLCSYFIGQRFINDPRMLAQEWTKQHISPYSRILISSYSPSFVGNENQHLKIISLPVNWDTYQYDKIIKKEDSAYQNKQQRLYGKFGLFNEKKLAKEG